MASVIANEFSEATGDLYLSALVEIGLALFIVTIIVNSGPIPGLDRDPRNSCEGPCLINVISSPADFADAPSASWRRSFELRGHGWRLPARCAGACSRWGLSSAICSTRESARSTSLPYPDSETAGRSRRRHGQRHRRIGVHPADCQHLRRSDGHWRGNLPGGVWPWHALWRTRSASPRMCSMACPRSSWVLWPMAWWCCSQGHFSALAGGVALGIMMVPTITRTTEEMLLMVPQADSRSSLRSGSFELAHHAFHHASHRDLGRHHRRDAGLCPGGRRNRAAAVYRVRQPVLELED